MTSTITYSFGEIVLVDFPFSSNIGSKKRPAVVISSNQFNEERTDLVLMAITSKVNKLGWGEAKIQEWDQAGLLKESALKSVIFTVERESIYKKLGTLVAVDIILLKTCLGEIFKSR
ncbi:MAG: type II toxin-antitoxin system PemK/MazF family toxin [Candidatus Melainabacteria bacterium]|nr:type II toxin-antitoxin system PemK/MazF family toxin [Candidatus Melainabacteria bacterium]